MALDKHAFVNKATHLGLTRRQAEYLADSIDSAASSATGPVSLAINGLGGSFGVFRVDTSAQASVDTPDFGALTASNREIFASHGVVNVQLQFQPVDFNVVGGNPAYEISYFGNMSVVKVADANGIPLTVRKTCSRDTQIVRALSMSDFENLVFGSALDSGFDDVTFTAVDASTTRILEDGFYEVICSLWGGAPLSP